MHVVLFPSCISVIYAVSWRQGRGWAGLYSKLACTDVDPALYLSPEIKIKVFKLTVCLYSRIYAQISILIHTELQNKQDTILTLTQF